MSVLHLGVLLDLGKVLELTVVPGFVALLCVWYNQQLLCIRLAEKSLSLLCAMGCLGAPGQQCPRWQFPLL